MIHDCDKNKTSEELMAELAELRDRLQYIENFNEYKKGAIEYINRQMRVNEALAILYKRLVSPHSTIEEISNVILEHVKRLTGSQHGFVAYIEETTRDMIACTMTEMMEDQCRITGEGRRIVFPIDSDGHYPSLWGHPLNIGQPIFTNSPSEHPASTGVPADHIPIERFLGVPAMLGDEMVGEIALANPLRDYTDQDLDAVCRLAEFFSVAVQHIRSKKILLISEEKYRKLFEEAIDGIGLADAETGIMIDCNQSLCNMVGRDKSEIIGQPQIILHPQDSPEDHALSFKRHIEMDGGVIETQLMTKTGEIKMVSIKANIVEMGEKKFFQGMFRDITEKKRWEEEVDKYREHLEELVRERTQQLSEANENLRQAQKMEAIGTLAGGIAHDFNNILGIIFGYTEMALLKVKDESTQNDMNRVLMAADRAKALVKQILTFSRKSKDERKAIFLNEMIEETANFLKSTIPSTIEIHVGMNDLFDALQADPNQLHQVIMNICTNGVYAMREKGGILRIELKNIELRSDSNIKANGISLNPGRYQRLSISDSGHGMPPEIMERIFEPYFTTKQHGEGTGLGLAVVHGIVKSHGAEITVESIPNKGTTFHIFFPIPAQVLKDKDDESAASKESLHGKGERILFIDDEEMLSELGKQTLERMGYKVTANTCSLKALELFRKNPQQFDLVVTDMSMPKMTGLQLASELKRIRPDMPVILCTGHNEFMDEARLKSTGIDAFVTKPIKMEEMAGITRKVFHFYN
ncbi:MAG: ATP-binding protein [Candidatus Omnitrophota bacterium]